MQILAYIIIWITSSNIIQNINHVNKIYLFFVFIFDRILAFTFTHTHTHLRKHLIFLLLLDNIYEIN